MSLVRELGQAGQGDAACCGQHASCREARLQSALFPGSGSGLAEFW